MVRLLGAHARVQEHVPRQALRNGVPALHMGCAAHLELGMPAHALKHFLADVACLPAPQRGRQPAGPGIRHRPAPDQHGGAEGLRRQQPLHQFAAGISRVLPAAAPARAAISRSESSAVLGDQQLVSPSQPASHHQEGSSTAPSDQTPSSRGKGCCSPCHWATGPGQPHLLSSWNAPASGTPRPAAARCALSAPSSTLTL